MPEPLYVIGNVLQTLMDIPSGQIMYQYEKWPIPKNSGLYISLAYGAIRPICNPTYIQFGGDDDSVMQELRTSTWLYEVQIDLLSFDSSARLQKETALMALASQYSQQQQEAASMQISKLPTAFLNTSSLEVTKILNRFTITIQVTALASLVVPITTNDYFDQFSFQLTTEQIPGNGNTAPTEEFDYVYAA